MYWYVRMYVTRTRGLLLSSDMRNNRAFGAPVLLLAGNLYLLKGKRDASKVRVLPIEAERSV